MFLTIIYSLLNLLRSRARVIKGAYLCSRTLRVNCKIDTLCQGGLIREVDSTCTPTDVLFPGVSARLSSPSGALRKVSRERTGKSIRGLSHLVATKCSSNLSSTGAYIDLRIHSQSCVPHPLRSLAALTLTIPQSLPSGPIHLPRFLISLVQRLLLSPCGTALFHRIASSK